MPEQVRFHLDEHVALAVAKGLRRRGIDCQTTTGAGLIAQDDSAQLAFAIAERRVLVTMDEGFLMPELGEHWGIAYCHPSSRRSIGELVAALELIHDVFTVEEMRNRIEFI